MSNELLEKVIQVTGGGGVAAGGGLLAPAQADRFIDYMWDATVLAPQVRSIRMTATEQEFNRIAVGERLVRLATEAVDDGVNAGATFSKISITTKKLRLDWELSSESLEDNLEGEALEDHIARMMATQAGNDLEDVAINGDVLATADPLLKSFDGWRKRAIAGGHVIDFAGAPIDRSVFHRALKAVPRKYMQRRGQLKFFAGTNLIQDYLFSLQNSSADYVTPEAMAAAGINQASVPTGPAGFTTGNAFGLNIQEVPLFNEQQVYDIDPGAGVDNVDTGEVWLTFPQNLLWGVKREIVVYRDFKPKKDTIEYTMYTRVGVQIENLDAVVVVRNIGVDE